MMNFFAKTFLFVALLTVVGMPGQAADSNEKYSMIPEVYLAGIPDVCQINSWYCGPASAQAVGMRHGIDDWQEEWAKEMKTTPENGTTPLDMLTCLEDAGLEARLFENMTIEELKEHLRHHRSVIVDYQAWPDEAVSDRSAQWEDGHYSVVLGFNQDVIFIEDPSLLGSVGFIPWKDFSERWHDYEIEDGKRHEYVHSAIVVFTPPKPAAKIVPID